MQIAQKKAAPFIYLFDSSLFKAFKEEKKEADMQIREYVWVCAKAATQDIPTAKKAEMVKAAMEIFSSTADTPISRINENDGLDTHFAIDKAEEKHMKKVCSKSGNIGMRKKFWKFILLALMNEKPIGVKSWIMVS